MKTTEMNSVPKNQTDLHGSNCLARYQETTGSPVTREEKSWTDVKRGSWLAIKKIKVEAVWEINCKAKFTKTFLVALFDPY